MVVVRTLGCIVPLFLLLLLAAPQQARASEQVYNLVNDGVRAQSEGNMQQALDIYTRIIDSGELLDDPKILAYLHNNRAVIMMQRDEPRRALLDLDRALELHPDPSTYYNRALILADYGDKEKALSDLDKALEMLPTYSNAYERRGRLLLEMGRPAQGRADLDKAKQNRHKISFLSKGEIVPFEVAPLRPGSMRVD